MTVERWKGNGWAKKNRSGDWLGAGNRDNIVRGGQTVETVRKGEIGERIPGQVEVCNWELGRQILSHNKKTEGRIKQKNTFF